MKSLGTKIAENRKLKHMTQEDLAVRLNVSPQAVSKWENDLSIPDLPILIELADIFNMSLDHLIREKETTDVQMVDPTIRKPIEQLIMRIVVDSADGDRVRVNLPMSIVKIGIEMGMAMPEVNGKEALKGIDFEQIFHLVDQGLIGKLVEVDSADGDHVEIFIE